jgi:hypothetical protein
MSSGKGRTTRHSIRSSQSCVTTSTALDYEAVRKAALNGGADAPSQAIAADLQVARELHSKGITRGVVDRQYRRVA